jgi:hypothetical protein
LARSGTHNLKRVHMKTLEERVEFYKYMWTDNISNQALLLDDEGQPELVVEFKADTGEPLLVLIERDDVREVVFESLRKAGVRIMTQEEYWDSVKKFKSSK